MINENGYFYFTIKFSYNFVDETLKEFFSLNIEYILLQLKSRNLYEFENALKKGEIDE